MIRQLQIFSLLTVQLIITSCTGYGLIYDDKRYDIDQETSEYEYNCIKQPTSECLLTSAETIAASMSNKVAQAEAYTILAKSYFELGKNQLAVNTVTRIEILTVQFSTLFELSYLAKQHLNPEASTYEFLALADTITLELQKPRDKIAALLLNAILSFKNQQPQTAKTQLNTAIALAKKMSKSHSNIIDIQFFKNILPNLIQFGTFETINELIALQAPRSHRFAAQVEYTVLLTENKPELAEQQFKLLLKKWHNLTDEQQRWAQASKIKLLLSFNRLKIAREIMQQQAKLINRATIAAVIIRQLTTQAKIDKAKQVLITLLRDIRLNTVSLSDLAPNTLAAIKQQVVQDEFTLDNLRAQAIADIALALSKADQMTEAVHFATQIQRRMGHIQGYTLTKLAIKYAKAGEINTALLTMESIHRPVNRTACLAQISAEVAKKSNKYDLDRAIVIANRINRQSWLDIANSEISITQAKLNDINAAMTTLKSIQRSFSAVYAMTEIARILHVKQNKQ